MRPVFTPDTSSYKKSNPVNTSDPHKNTCNLNEYPDLTLSNPNFNDPAIKFRDIHYIND